MVQKFLFDTRFDAPPPPEPVVVEDVPAEPVPPPPPTFSEAELAAAKTDAHAKGFAEGLAKARTEAQTSEQRLQSELLDKLSLRVAELLTEQAARAEQARQMVLQIALTITRKLLPTSVARYGLTEIEGAVQKILAQLTSEPRVVIRVHDSQLDAVTAAIEPQAQQRGFNGKLVFLVDSSLGPADCKVEWADGGLERDSDRLWQQIDGVVAEVLQSGPRNPEMSEAEIIQPTTQIES